MNEYVKYALITAGIIGLFILYAFEFTYFNRTFYIQRLAIIAIILGMVMGAVSAWRLQKWATSQLERLQLYIACILFAAIFMPLFASLTNRLLSFHPVEKLPVEFVEEKPYFNSRFGITSEGQARPSSHRSFIYWKEDLLGLQTETPLFSEAKRGDTIQLAIKKGLWGFEFVPK